MLITMKALLTLLSCLLGGLLSLTLCVYLICTDARMKEIIASGVFGFFLLFVTYSLWWCDRRDGVRYFEKKTKGKILWTKGNTWDCALPFEVLHRNFRTLKKYDENTIADKDFLSWNSGSFAEIRIEKVESAPCDTWLGIYWCRANRSMSKSTLTKLCAKHGLEAPSTLFVKPHGLLIYQDGKLNQYPAVNAEEVREAFLETVLSRDENFTAWIKEYGAE